MNIIKKKVSLIICLAISLYSQGQSKEYKIFILKDFGIVTLPVTLDTIGQKIHKGIIADRIDEISENKFDEIKNTYHYDLSKTLLNYTLNGEYRFWSTNTINYFFDTVVNMLSTGNKFDNIDYSKLATIPNVSLKKDINPVGSNYIMGHVFSNKDSTSALLTIIENMMRNLTNTLSDSKVIGTTSSYTIIQNKYPLIKASSFYTASDNIEYVMTFYFLYKQNFRYSIKFGYKKEEIKKWDLYMNKFITELQVN